MGRSQPFASFDKKVIDRLGLKQAIVLSVFQEQRARLDYSQLSDRLCFLSGKKESKKINGYQ